LPHNLEADNHKPLLIDLSKLWLFGCLGVKYHKKEKRCSNVPKGSALILQILADPQLLILRLYSLTQSTRIYFSHAIEKGTIRFSFLYFSHAIKRSYSLAQFLFSN
jgi:hypothetical protein